MPLSNLANEWSLLQNQFDSYEKFSLQIKLFAIGLLSIGYFTNNLGIFVFSLLLILWLQDAIWKTFQSRIDTRLLQIEQILSVSDNAQNIDSEAYLFNSQFLKSRPSNMALIKVYLRQAVKPTVAYPHAVLVLLLCFNLSVQV